jgi:hypothetical protein
MMTKEQQEVAFEALSASIKEQLTAAIGGEVSWVLCAVGHVEALTKHAIGTPTVFLGEGNVGTLASLSSSVLDQVSKRITTTILDDLVQNKEKRAYDIIQDTLYVRTRKMLAEGHGQEIESVVLDKSRTYDK